MHRLRTVATALVIVTLAAAAHGQMSGPVQVYLEPAAARSIRRAAELTGVAEARRHSTLSAETAGRVEKMLVDAGDFAAAGAPVCQMRRLPVELQLKQAEGQLASAQAQLKKAEQGFRVEEVHQAEARVKAAQAAFERARQDQDRTLRLLKDGASTPAERDAVEAAFRQAKEQLAEAEAGQALFRSGTRVEDIDSARAQAATQAAAVESLKDTLTKMTVAMPFDGYIVRKCTEEGEWLNPGVPVVEVSDLGVVRIQVDVPERYLAGLVKGASTPVVFDSLGDREFTGVISQIVPKAAEGTHTIPVRVDVANVVENGRPVIAAGLLAKVWLPVGAEHQALLVPKAAVIRQEGRDVVYTVADAPPAGAAAPPPAPKNGGGAKPAEKVGPPAPPVQFAVAVPVRILQGYGRWMEVESDKLKAGTPLVTRGTYLLSPGAAVQVYPKERIVDVPAAQPATKGAKAGAAE
jgi:multidrug efflux pump subunit AcrA (membrane-fusion protein)